MKLVMVRRTATPAATKAAPPASAAPHTLRRLRTATSRLQQQDEAATKIRELLKSIAESDAAIDRAVEAKESALAQIEALLRDSKLPLVDDGNLLAELVEKFSRQQRTIKPKKFRTKVTNDQFWDCIDISVVRAAKYLGQKELDAISDVVPSKSLGHQLVVREIKHKTKKP